MDWALDTTTITIFFLLSKFEYVFSLIFHICSMTMFCPEFDISGECTGFRWGVSRGGGSQVTPKPKVHLRWYPGPIKKFKFFLPALCTEEFLHFLPIFAQVPKMSFLAVFGGQQFSAPAGLGRLKAAHMLAHTVVHVCERKTLYCFIMQAENVCGSLDY